MSLLKAHDFHCLYEDVIAEEFEGGLNCDRCEKPLVKEAYPDGEQFICEMCATAVIEQFVPVAKRYARIYCRITKLLPDFDSEFECEPSSADHVRSDELTRSEKEYAAHCRHECTNYDFLIANVDRESIRGRILYRAVRERIMHMLSEFSDYRMFYEDPLL